MTESKYKALYEDLVARMEAGDLHARQYLLDNGLVEPTRHEIESGRAPGDFTRFKDPELATPKDPPFGGQFVTVKQSETKTKRKKK